MVIIFNVVEMLSFLFNVYLTLPLFRLVSSFSNSFQKKLSDDDLSRIRTQIIIEGVHGIH